jgi:hypothetical protein
MSGAKEYGGKIIFGCNTTQEVKIPKHNRSKALPSLTSNLQNLAVSCPTKPQKEKSNIPRGMAKCI